MTTRHARWVLIVLSVPMVVVPVWFTGLGGVNLGGRDLVAAVLLGLVLGWAQLRISIAAGRDERPAGWMWTLPLLLAVVYLPLVFLSWSQSWSAAQLCAQASVLMLLRGWPRIAGFTVLVAISITVELLGSPLDSLLSVVFAVLYGITLSAYPVVLYLAARLVRVLSELESSRAELAEAAVSRERLRLSRDLHDLFGQSLSAISLKGGLALRLLPDDPDGARAEITGLTELARETLRSMRKVSRNEHVVSLRTEVDGAAALLATAGAGTGITADTDGLSPGTEQIFGWAVREGVTNMLRHSEVRNCSITIAVRDGAARLEIVNDGVRGPRGAGGNGLTGLADRAGALGGSVTTGQAGDEFRLVVEIPEGAG